MAENGMDLPDMQQTTLTKQTTNEFIGDLADEIKSDEFIGNEDDSSIIDNTKKIKLMGLISKYDTPALLQIYKEIYGLEPLRQVILQTFVNNIPVANIVKKDPPKVDSGVVPPAPSEIYNNASPIPSAAPIPGGAPIAPPNGKAIVAPPPVPPSLGSLRRNKKNKITLDLGNKPIDKKIIDKYFALKTYPRDLGIFNSNAEVPDDIYLRIFSFFGYRELFCVIKKVSRAWFHVGSKPASLSNLIIKLPLKVSNLNDINWHRFVQVKQLDIISGFVKPSKFDYSDAFGKLVPCINNLRSFKFLFNEKFGMYIYSTHPLKRLLTKQMNLKCIHIGFKSDIGHKFHVDNVLQCLKENKYIDKTLTSCIFEGLCIKESCYKGRQRKGKRIKKSLQINVENKDNDGDNDDNKDNNKIDFKNIKVTDLGLFLLKCKELEVFKMINDELSTETMVNVYYSFIHYFNNNGGNSKIIDLELPSFALRQDKYETLLWGSIIKNLNLKKLVFHGNLYNVSWLEMGQQMNKLSELYIKPTKGKDEQFKYFLESISDCNGIKTLTIDTTYKAAGLGYNSDELSSYIIPYFKKELISNVKILILNVKYLLDNALFSFLKKLKGIHNLETLKIYSQSYSNFGKKHNKFYDDIKKGAFNIGNGNQSGYFVFELYVRNLYVPGQIKSIKCIKNTECNDIKNIKMINNWQKKRKKGTKKVPLSVKLAYSLHMKRSDILSSGGPRFG
mmetsp:Transcript_71769/g.87997  ORF Transcript_71769/g.87997 Transcript_71769/m.87997 type:complete len:728 (+) Transcript_71769:39-2222(+)